MSAVPLVIGDRSAALPAIVYRRQLADAVGRPIIVAVALAWNLPATGLLGRSRRVSFMPARFALYRLLRGQGLSLALVAWAAGRKDHGTVVSGLRRAEQYRSSDAEWRLLYVAATALAGLLEESPT